MKMGKITTGGIRTKILAALIANSMGIPCVITNLDGLDKSGFSAGTLFLIPPREAEGFLKKLMGRKRG